MATAKSALVLSLNFALFQAVCALKFWIDVTSDLSFVKTMMG